MQRTDRVCLKHLFSLAVTALFIFAFSVFAQEATTTNESKEPEKKEEKAKTPPPVTESITVEATAPKELPYSSTSIINEVTLKETHPKDVSDVLSMTTGTFVSVGGKNEWSIKIRGLDTSRSTMVYDGIPVYEPYYNSYDLKSFLAYDIGSLKIVKGASSVLYGPNTLGGIVELTTLRPNPPSLHLSTFAGSNSTYGQSGSGSIKLGDLTFVGSATHEKSNGFNYLKNGEKTERQNSDYERSGIDTKVYLYPWSNSEILGEVEYTKMDYGIPWTTDSSSSKRYWRFNDWYRVATNVGGTFPILETGNLKVRTYYVKYYNVLDSYTSPSINKLQYESTYDNHSYGAFALGTVPVGDRQEVRASLTIHSDHAKTQASTTAPWLDFNQNIASGGVEDNFKLTEQWSVMGGFSVDHLSKEEGKGNNKTTVNPIAGVKFNPRDDLDLHFTVCQKSRFPSMRSLYSSTAGNPDLSDERGTNVEFGFTWSGWLKLSSAIFNNNIHDMIDRKFLPDGTFVYFNYKKARLRGFELELEKSMNWFTFSTSYTYLDARNITESRPLDITPKNQFNAAFTVTPHNYFSATIWGLAVSKSEVKNSNIITPVAGYAIINATIQKEFFQMVNGWVKIENMLNKDYVTEPGYPMKARTFSIGLDLRLGGNR